MTALGPYELVTEIGRGGMGSVHRAVDVKDFDRAIRLQRNSVREIRERVFEIQTDRQPP
jgi:hypothetical protein